MGSPHASVDDFASVKAHDSNGVQQFSISSPQQVQQQSLGSRRFLQVSIMVGIWFGTRGSEVQILSPRPMFSCSTSILRPANVLICVCNKDGRISRGTPSRFPPFENREGWGSLIYS